LLGGFFCRSAEKLTPLQFFARVVSIAGALHNTLSGSFSEVEVIAQKMMADLPRVLCFDFTFALRTLLRIPLPPPCRLSTTYVERCIRTGTSEEHTLSFSIITSIGTILRNWESRGAAVRGFDSLTVHSVYY